jgi:hypothetical protein
VELHGGDQKLSSVGLGVGAGAHGHQLHAVFHRILRHLFEDESAVLGDVLIAGVDVGLDVLRVEVGAIDFSKDTVMVKMYYEPLTNEVNSVNQVGRLPKVG